MDGTVLVADDDKTIRTVLVQALNRAGCKVQATASLLTLMRWIREGKGNLVISDIMMPDGNGLELLPEIREIRPDLPIIIISAQNTFTTAIKVEEGRAFDYLPKPFDLPTLLHKVSLGLNSLERVSKKKLPKFNEELPLIGSSIVMLELYRKLAKLMNLEDTVLILGESGTGKTLIANSIHNFSDRRTLSLIEANHKVFSNFDSAFNLLKIVKGGTILIEDINLFNLEKQNTLKRILDYDLEINPRFIITAQSLDPVGSLDYQLEPSLLFRLNKLIINVPPLRLRLSDLDVLVNHFLKKNMIDREHNLKFDKDAFKIFKNYSWPGNLRQLENVIYSLDLNSFDRTVSKETLKIMMNEQPEYSDLNEEKNDLLDAVTHHLNIYFGRHGNMLPPDGVYKRVINEIEYPLIQIALKACGGNQVKCAKLLGLNRNTLRKKLEQSDISVTKYKKLM